MAPLLLDADDVRALLSPEDCRAAVEEVFASCARGEVVQPQRVVAWRPDERGAMAAMPAFIGDPPILGAKLIAVFPGNRRRGIPSHQGVVVLHDPEDGRVLAILDAGAITSLRTAAASALATKILCKADAASLALLGSGEQAWEHLRAMRTVRPVREVRVWSRTRAHALAFVRRAEEAFGIPVHATETAREAVRRADIVCTLTASTTPILHGEWLSEGTHVNAVGASTPAFRELDAEAVARSRLFADSRTSLATESMDYLGALEEGAIGEDHLLGDLGDLVTGRVQGRRDLRDITLFKSLGLSIEDLAAARLVLIRAKDQKRGTEVKFGAE
jgi:alanine dehydrogenase